MTEITIKSGRGKPAKTDLAEAELALDVSTGTIYSKLDSGNITALNTAEFLGVDGDADNYQYWRYKVNGSSTVNVFSMQDVDFQAGDGIEIQQKGYGIEISSTATGGGGVHIGANPPADPEEGQQWMEVPASGDATMWIYDDGNGGQWLQHPGGKDGAPGLDGADGNIADGTEDGIVATWDDVAGQWTPDSSMVIDNGNVGIGIDNPTAPLHTKGFTRITTDDTGHGSNNGFLTSIGSNKEVYLYNYENSDLVFATNGIYRMRIDANGRVDITGSLYVNGNPKIGADDLIRTLETLRNATKDETTLEGLRDAIGNAIGGLIEEFENQIATMPAEGDES
jgi:hypothetical protein